MKAKVIGVIASIATVGAVVLGGMHLASAHNPKETTRFTTAIFVIVNG